MKLQVKAAGLCGTGVLTMAILTAIFHNADPWEILVVSLPAGVVSGLLGYLIGDILAKPKGPSRSARSRKNAKKSFMGKPVVTGEETFLSDAEISRPAAGAFPIDASRADED